jgi:hypothetical protein
MDTARINNVIERIRGGEFPDFEERYSKGYSFATLGDVLERVGKAFRQVGKIAHEWRQTKAFESLRQ